MWTRKCEFCGGMTLPPKRVCHSCQKLNTRPYKDLQRYEYSLLECIEELHMSLNGSSDCLGEQDEKDLVASLRNRLNDWMAPHSPYSNLVKQMLEQVLKEYEDHQDYLQSLVASDS